LKINRIRKIFCPGVPSRRDTGRQYGRKPDKWPLLSERVRIELSADEDEGYFAGTDYPSDLKIF